MGHQSSLQTINHASCRQNCDRTKIATGKKSEIRGYVINPGMVCTWSTVGIIHFLNRYLKDEAFSFYPINVN